MDKNREPNVAEFTLSAQVSFFVGFSVVSSLFLLASSNHPFLSVTSPCDDGKERVEERLGDLGRRIVKPGWPSLLLVPRFVSLLAFL